MQSKYSIRLFELLKSYAHFGTVTLEVEHLKEQLQIQTEQYTRWQNLKDRVLQPAIKEINEYTDLTVSYTTERTGRHISDINFSIEIKSSAQQLLTKLNREAKLYPEK